MNCVCVWCLAAVVSIRIAFSCRWPCQFLVCLSASCTKKAKAIWQPPTDKREGCEEKQGWRMGWGRCDLSTCTELFFLVNSLLEMSQTTGWHTPYCAAGECTHDLAQVSSRVLRLLSICLFFFVQILSCVWSKLLLSSKTQCEIIKTKPALLKCCQYLLSIRFPITFITHFYPKNKAEKQQSEVKSLNLKVKGTRPSD